MIQDFVITEPNIYHADCLYKMMQWSMAIRSPNIYHDD